MTEEKLLKTYGREVFLRAAEIIREMYLESEFGSKRTNFGCCLAIERAAKEINGVHWSDLYPAHIEFFKTHFKPKYVPAIGFWWSTRRGNIINSRIAYLLHAADLVG